MATSQLAIIPKKLQKSEICQSLPARFLILEAGPTRMDRVDGEDRQRREARKGKNRFLKFLGYTRDPSPKQHAKRIFDILFSSFFLMIGAPLYFLLFLLVKKTSQGPAFHKGLRMGQNGQLIWFWKFRTMVVDADQKLAALLEKKPEMRSEWETYLKLKNDPRITKIGAFLRKTSLDELPQFWNVLKGDLSVVGPRPLPIFNPDRAEEEILSKYCSKTKKILSVRPGITGLWQLNGRSELSLKERAVFEEEYVNTQSLWLDLKIICKTVYILFVPKGAY